MKTGLMGISPNNLDVFAEFSARAGIGRGDSFLDVGVSELFCADDPDSINRFVAHFGGQSYPQDELARMANRGLAQHLMARCGLNYAAIDYADFPSVIRLDLNKDRLPVSHHGQYQLICNAGTSEHILHQYNVFEVIHDAASEGALMYHGVPAWGDFEHGVLHYSPRFFWALAKANQYEIVRFTGWAADKAITLPEEFLRQIPFNCLPHIQNAWLHVLLRKTVMAPFEGLNDPMFSASATEVDFDVSVAK
jgi:hypothetical protein